MPESSLLPCCRRSLFTVFAPCLAPQRALDANLLSFTVWNYCAENSNERGDLWNDEDLSVFSPDQRHRPEDLHSGRKRLSEVAESFSPLRRAHAVSHAMTIGNHFALSVVLASITAEPIDVFLATDRVLPAAALCSDDGRATLS